MKITEFLQGRNVKRQAVTRYINRHEDFFAGHIQKVSKEIDLDMVAVRELEKVYPLEKPITVLDGIPHEVFEKVQAELIATQQKNSELMAKLLDATEQISMAKATQVLLEDKTKRIDALETLSEAQKQSLREKDEQIHSLQEKLEIERSKGWLKKLFGKK